MDRMSLTRLSRRAIVAVGLLLAPLAMQAVPAAAAPSPAEAWVAQNVQQGLTILNKKQAQQARRDEFKTFLLGLIDIRAISLYTLGSGARTSTPQQQDQFVEAFKEYASAVYYKYLAQYSGQTLKVTGSVAGRPNEWIVHTVLIDPHNPNNADPFKVDFRVSQSSGKFLVKDACVEGIWLAILEHDDFDSFLGQNGGNVGKLIDHLHKLTSDLQKG
ncbi:MAG TPA: ABC transporter substrate-binding protein [Rhizomicrobium sp.]|jgi:phospholipid transport system substrate-binding protein|nr:ABC transporter substrate-binding protein [Rhizomicrobium sp.]